MKNKIVILLIISIITMQLPIGTIFAETNINPIVNEVATDLYGLGVTCHENSFIAVGKNGSIKLSTDGSRWENEGSGVSTNLNAAIWGNGKYVAVGDAGIILNSKDGKSWSKASTNVKYGINGIVWTGKQYVAVGDGESILTSSDGSSWKVIQYLEDGQSLKAVAWNGTRYVAVGSEGAILTSENGLEWTNQNSNTDKLLNAVIWAQNQFVVVGSQKTILTSSDGLKWEITTSSYDNYLSYYSIAWNGKQYMAVGNYGNIATSEDGVYWYDNEYPTGNYQPLYGVVSSSNKFIAVGLNYTTSIAPSEEGVLKISEYVVANDLYGTGIVFNNGKYVAIGNKGVIKTSTNPLYWNKVDTGVSADLYDITYGDKYIVVGASGTILTSNDGGNWEQQDYQTYSNLNSVAWSGKTYVVVGKNGTVLTSNDGVSWQKVEISSYEHLRNVIWDGKNFEAFGYGIFLRSKDGVSWEKTYSINSDGYNDVCFGNNKYVAITNGGMTICTSYDGENWTKKSILGYGYDGNFSAITWNGTEFAAVGSRGAFFTSPDGENWTKQLSTSLWMGDVVWDGNEYVVATNNGILVVGDLTNSDTDVTSSEEGNYSKSFSDLPQNHWAYSAVMDMAEKGIIKGYSDGTFKPNNVVSRAEFATMMVGALNLEVVQPETPTFKDVQKNNWAYKYVESVKNFITGEQKADGLYYKDKNNAVREDMVCALVKAKGYQNEAVDLSKLDTLFSDSKKITSGLKKYVLIAYEKNITKGNADNTFNPQGTLTRAEAAKLLYNVMNIDD